MGIRSFFHFYAIIDLLSAKFAGGYYATNCDM